MVNTRKSSLRLLGSKSPGPGPGPGAGAEPGATGGSSHFISSRTRSSKTRAASCPGAKAGGSGGAGVALEEARVRARRPESGGLRGPARPPGLCLAGLGQEASSGDRLGGWGRGSAGAVKDGTRLGRAATALLVRPFCVRNRTGVWGERTQGGLFGDIGTVCFPCPCRALEGNSREAGAEGRSRRVEGLGKRSESFLRCQTLLVSVSAPAGVSTPAYSQTVWGWFKLVRK